MISRLRFMMLSAWAMVQRPHLVITVCPRLSIHPSYVRTPYCSSYSQRRRPRIFRESLISWLDNGTKRGARLPNPNRQPQPSPTQPNPGQGSSCIYALHEPRLALCIIYTYNWVHMYISSASQPQIITSHPSCEIGHVDDRFHTWRACRW